MRPTPRCTVLLCLSLVACLLSACGGGGSSGSSGYTIGGNVSGLTQLPGVVLENNGGDALTISTSGNFTFSKSLASGTAYDVTVESSPAGQSCQVASGGQGTATARVSSISVVCTSAYASGAAANVAPISVDPGPADANYQTFNIPQVTVKVCQPGNPSDCATIQNVLVDTGSSGLRLISSALPTGFTLPAVQDGSGNHVFECMPFADGYSWGGVVTAFVTIGGETTAQPIPVQIIDSAATQTEIPTDCSKNAGSLSNTVDNFDANGVLGVSTLNLDCDSYCTVAGNRTYFGCPAAATCNENTKSEATPLTDQVANPVASFPTDNNGVIVQLPALSATGAMTATGYLVFGIGTESASATEADNHLNGATVLTTNGVGLFTTNFSGTQLPYSFLDSGSNALYFPQPTPNLTTCQKASDFYCPTSNTSLSATNTGINGATSTVSFVIANLNSLPGTSFAVDDIGGLPTSIQGFGTSGTSYFDWGLPFFYGRTVFTAIENMPADGTQGPYYAY